MKNKLERKMEMYEQDVQRRMNPQIDFKKRQQKRYDTYPLIGGLVSWALTGLYVYLMIPLLLVWRRGW